MHTVEMTPDGWYVTDPKSFRLIVDHPPPRPWGHWNQIRVDMKHWMPVAIWFICTAFVVAGFATPFWFFVFPGVYGFVRWFRIAHMSVRDIRSCPVASGVIDALRKHPLVRTCIQQLRKCQMGKRYES